MVKKTFNTVSTGYDNQSLRVFSESARHMAVISDFKGNEHILDVARGIGYAALAVARAWPGIQVTGIDFSKGMPAQADTKAAKEKLHTPYTLHLATRLETAQNEGKAPKSSHDWFLAMRRRFSGSTVIMQTTR